MMVMCRAELSSKVGGGREPVGLGCRDVVFGVGCYNDICSFLYDLVHV